MGENCTSVPARVAACLSRLCHTNMLDCSYIHGLCNQRLSQSSCWKDLKSTKYKMYPKCIPLEWFVSRLSKNVSLRLLHKHSVTANCKLLVITISVISMSFPPAYTLLVTACPDYNSLVIRKSVWRGCGLVDVTTLEWSSVGNDPWHQIGCRAWTR